jgi:hypothetical protein
LAVLFGVLIEWKRLKTIFTGNLSVNWLLLPSLVLIIAGSIPVFCYLYFLQLPLSKMPNLSSCNVYLKIVVTPQLEQNTLFTSKSWISLGSLAHFCAALKSVIGKDTPPSAY